MAGSYWNISAGIRDPCASRYDSNLNRIWTARWQMQTVGDYENFGLTLSEKMGVGYFAHSQSSYAKGGIAVSFDITTGELVRRIDDFYRAGYVIMTIGIDETTEEVHFGGFFQPPTLPVKLIWYILRNGTMYLEQYTGTFSWSAVHIIFFDSNRLLGMISTQENEVGRVRIFNLTAPVVSQTLSSQNTEPSSTIAELS